MANTSFDSGFAYGRQAANQRGQHAQMLSDEEHEQALNDHNVAIQNLQGQLSKAAPNTPEYFDLQDQLGKTLDSRTQLFHPSVGGPARLANYLRDKLGVNPPTTPQVSAQTPAGAPTSLPGTASSMGVAQTLPGAAAGPTVSTPAQGKAQLDTAMSGVPPAPVNQYSQFRDKLKSALPHLTDDELDNAVKIQAGIAPKPVAPKAEVWKSKGQPYQEDDGKWYIRQENATGELRKQVMPDGYQSAKKDPTSKDGRQRMEYVRAKYGPDATIDKMTWDDEENMQRALKDFGAGKKTSVTTGFVSKPDGSIVAVAKPSSTQTSYGSKPVTPVEKPVDPLLANPRGLLERGNIPLTNRPVVANDDGTHSSEYSVSFADDDNGGKEVLVPTVVGGKFLTPDGKKPVEGSEEEEEMFNRAWEHYKDTGEHLGIFDNEHNATTYASALHNRNEDKIPDNSMSPTAGQLKKKAQQLAIKQGADATAKVPKPATMKAPKNATSKDTGYTKENPSPVATPGAIVGGKDTPTQTKAKQRFDEAVGLQTLADRAQKEPNAQNQRDLVLAIIKTSAGRVNMQEYDAMTKRAGIANTVEAWAKGASTGMLPDEIWKGILGVAHDYKVARQAEVNAAEGHGTVRMRSPTGAEQEVQPEDVEHYELKGAKVIP